MDLDSIKEIIGIVPALLVPVIAWFLSQHGESRRFKEFENLLTRIELVEKLSQHHDMISGENKKLAKILDSEIRDIFADLDSTHEINDSSSNTALYGELIMIRRILLLHKQTSLKGTIYKWLFYIFSIIFPVLGVIGSISASEVNNGSWIYIIFGIYFVVGLGFRSAAVKNYEKILKKSQSIGQTR